MITFKLPTQLRAMAAGRKTIEVDAATLGDAFRRMDETAPMIRSQVLDDAGNVRAFVGVFVNAEQLTALDDGAHVLPPGSQIAIVMAVAGG
jgi:molybdopterin converting factor small subunit